MSQKCEQFSYELFFDMLVIWGSRMVPLRRWSESIMKHVFSAPLLTLNIYVYSIVQDLFFQIGPRVVEICFEFFTYFAKNGNQSL